MIPYTVNLNLYEENSICELFQIWIKTTNAIMHEKYLTSKKIAK